jgi:hypothetical protein
MLTYGSPIPGHSGQKDPPPQFTNLGLKLPLLGWCRGSLSFNAEHRAANLRAIMDDLQGFTSVRAIAAQLNERGIFTPRGGSWHPTSAARLMSRLQAIT